MDDKANEMIYEAYKKVEEVYEYIKENNIDKWDASFVEDIKGLSEALLFGTDY